jgi:hypothetical protein
MALATFLWIFYWMRKDGMFKSTTTARARYAWKIYREAETPWSTTYAIWLGITVVISSGVKIVVTFVTLILTTAIGAVCNSWPWSFLYELYQDWLGHQRARPH